MSSATAQRGGAGFADVTGPVVAAMMACVQVTERWVRGGTIDLKGKSRGDEAFLGLRMQVAF